jgi:hypothetical protein
VQRNAKYRAGIFGGIIFVASASCLHAESIVKVLTPVDDTCLAYTKAMESVDNSTATLGNWVVGFFSGVAQGSNVDILKDVGTIELLQRVYFRCMTNPDEEMSASAERVARELLAAAQQR